jgi:CRP/FNR family cyclic AMP-dependent transcriptional regulator
VTAITAHPRQRTYQVDMERTLTQGCLNCESRPDRTFCDMPADSLRAFDEIKSVGSYPRNTVLFAEGRPVRGVYVLCDGRAKLSICAGVHKRMALRVAGPGEVLGLGAALSNTPYEITAELLDASQVVFVRRKDLMRFLRDHPEACMQVVRMLSQDLHGAYERVRSIGMIHSRRPRTILRPRAVLA